MKELYPIEVKNPTKPDNFLPIAMKFWETFKLRFTAVDFSYNPVTKEKSLTQCPTRYKSNLKPMNMTDEEYEDFMLSNPGYWIANKQFAWTLGPNPIGLAIIDLDFETMEEYLEFRKEIEGTEFDKLLDSATYVEKSMKRGGFHFFVAQDESDPLLQNVTGGSQIFVKGHLVLTHFTSPDYRALTNDCSLVPSGTLAQIIYILLLYTSNFINSKSINNINIFKGTREQIYINKEYKDIRGGSSDVSSDMVVSETQMTLESYKPLAPVLTQLLSKDDSTESLIDFEDFELLRIAKFIDNKLFFKNYIENKRLLKRGILELFKQSAPKGQRYSYLNYVTGVLAANPSVSEDLAYEFLDFLAEKIGFSTEKDYNQPNLLAKLINNGSFTYDPLWKEKIEFNKSNASELYKLLNTSIYDKEIYIERKPSYCWLPVKILGKNDEFMIVNVEKTKEKGYLDDCHTGSKTSTIDILKVINYKQGKKIKPSIEDCLLIEKCFKPNSSELVIETDHNVLADAIFNTFKPSSFLKNLKKANIEYNPSREQQIEEFERLCPTLSELIDNVVDTSKTDKTRKLWLLNHFHHILLERPSGKEEIVVFHGDKGGEGKTTLAEFFSSLVTSNIQETFDRNGCTTYELDKVAEYSISSDIKEFCGNFNNKFLDEKLFIIVNEGDFKDEAQKNAVVEKCKFIASPGKKSITAKFEHTRIMDTYANIIICTNYQELVFNNKEKNQMDRRAMEFFARSISMVDLPIFKNAIEQNLVNPNKLTDLLYQEVPNLIEWFNSRLIDYKLIAERPMADRVESERELQGDGIHQLIEMIESKVEGTEIIDFAKDCDLLSVSSNSKIFDRDAIEDKNADLLKLMINAIYQQMDRNEKVYVRTGELNKIFGKRIGTKIKEVWIRSYKAVYKQRFYDGNAARKRQTCILVLKEKRGEG